MPTPAGLLMKIILRVVNSLIKGTVVVLRVILSYYPHLILLLFYDIDSKKKDMKNNLSSTHLSILPII